MLLSGGPRKNGEREEPKMISWGRVAILERIVQCESINYIKNTLHNFPYYVLPPIKNVAVDGLRTKHSKKA